MACVKLVGGVVSGVISTGGRCSSSGGDTCLQVTPILIRVDMTYELREQQCRSCSFFSILICTADWTLPGPNGKA